MVGSASLDFDYLENSCYKTCIPEHGTKDVVQKVPTVHHKARVERMHAQSLKAYWVLCFCCFVCFFPNPTMQCNDLFLEFTLVMY